MKMTNLGKKIPKTGVDGPAIASGNDKARISYPSFSLDAEQIPDFLDSLPMNKMVRCEVVICKSSHNENKEYGDDKRMGFSVYKIGLLGAAGKKSKDEYMKMSDDEKSDYDQDQMENDGDEEESAEE